MEGLPNVLIEAQACGIPVVAPAVGGAVETFIEGLSGLGVADGTPESFAGAITRLLLHPELRVRMGQQASTWARAKFSIETMIADTIEAYRLAPAVRTGSPNNT
jgi:glycosyltransferase involved in cell wall biosynthesis